MILHQAMFSCILCSFTDTASWVEDDEQPKLTCPMHPDSAHLMKPIRSIDTEISPEAIR